MMSLYLSEYLERDDVVLETKKQFSFIIAPAGCGKTSSMLALCKKLNVDPSLCVCIVPFNALQEQQSKESDVEVVTGTTFVSNLDKYRNYKLFVVDEVHTFCKRARIALSKLRDKSPNWMEFDTMCLALYKDNPDYVLLDTLQTWARDKDCYAIGMTATPHHAEQCWLFKDSFNCLVSSQADLVTYKVLEKKNYSRWQEIAHNDPGKGHKRLIYVDNVQMAYDIKKEIELSTPGRNVQVLFSLYNPNYKMDANQRALRAYVLETQKLPPYLDDLIITGAYSEGVNITDELVDSVWVHNRSKDVQTQVVGRVRHDVQTLYVYNSEEHKSEQQTKKRKEQRANDKILQQVFFKEELLGQELTSQEVLDEVGYKSWKGLKQIFEQSGYCVEGPIRRTKNKVKTNYYIVTENKKFFKQNN